MSESYQCHRCGLWCKSTIEPKGSTWCERCQKWFIPSAPLNAQRLCDDLRKEIEWAINRHSAENGSNTPDWLLAEYLIECLNTFDRFVTAREKWYGRGPRPVSPDDPKPCP